MATRYLPLLELTPSLPTEDDTLTIPEARECIKTKFATYHKLLDEKESELLAELELLEETNKPEIKHVRSDLMRLRGVVSSFDESLGTQSLKKFREEQKKLCKEHVLHFERSERLLSHVKLKLSENFVENLIQIVPFWSNAKFRTELQPVLKLEPKLGEDWYVVSDDWFSEFTSSINLTNPQQNDKLEFPVKIPIQTSGSSVEVLHSKAWDMLLAFNGLSPDSIPIKRQTFLNETTNKIEVPKQPTEHKCTIGHNFGNTKFSIECVIETFPCETYQDILNTLSGFSALFIKHAPILYVFDDTITLSCNIPKYTQYTVKFPYNSRGVSIRSPNIAVPVQNTESSVGNTVKRFLLIIPDSTGHTPFEVTKSRSSYSFWSY